MTLAPAAIDALCAAAGDGGWTRDPDDLAAASRDWRGQHQGRTPLLLRPRSVAAVQAIVRAAGRHRVALVPQGGNTGLVQGGVPDGSGTEVLLSLTGLDRIRAVDADGFSLTAEAGVILADVQAAAARVDRLFPLSLASEGTARIGGLVATNAGGVQVLRYGAMRAQVLGLEAVLANGQRIDTLSPLRKNTSGFDLTQLLIGSEGTLGIITAATLRLVPAHHAVATALLALPDPAHAVPLLARLRAATGDLVHVFELMPRDGLDLVLRHVPGTSPPFAPLPPWVVLVELASPVADAPLAELLESVLDGALADGWISDAVIAQSRSQAAALWRLRETLPEAEKRDGRALKHDIAVPIGRIADLLARAGAAVARLAPDARVLAFGHVGDGNLHYNVRPPADPAAHPAFFAAAGAISAAVHDATLALGGTLAAEHGIGRLKVGELARTLDPARLAAMHAVKAALDPHGLLNPGRILASARQAPQHEPTPQDPLGQPAN